MSKSASSDSKSSSSSDEGKKKKREPVDVSVKVEGKELVIRVPMQKAKESASGKTMVIASTRGNVKTDATIDGHQIIIGLNAYYYKP